MNSAYNNDSLQSNTIFFLAAVWFLWMTWRITCDSEFICRALCNPASWAGLAGAYLLCAHLTKRLTFFQNSSWKYLLLYRRIIYEAHHALNCFTVYFWRLYSKMSGHFMWMKHFLLLYFLTQDISCCSSY